MKYSVSKYLAVTATVAMATAAQADHIQLDFNPQFAFGESVTVQMGTLVTQGFALPLLATQIGPDSGPSFITYCTDAFENLIIPGYVKQNPVATAVDGVVATGIHNTASVHQDWIVGGLNRALFLFKTYGSQVDTSAEGAGLQLAIWNSLYDADSSIESGLFFASSASGPAMAKANEFLAGSLGQFAPGVWFQPVDEAGRPLNDRGQGVLGNPPQGGEVPEPGELAILGAGLLGLAGMVVVSRRRALMA